VIPFGDTGQSRECVVSFRDREGVEHVAEVTAESLFEAAALALNQFRGAEWSREPSRDPGTLRVEVCESTFYGEGCGVGSMVEADGRGARRRNREAECEE
jgi:hypothetical protein